MKNKTKIFLLLIFFLALVLRLFRLGENPTFISDEASLGYNAYSILKTRRDEWGKFLPFSFKSFGEYKLPVYIYLTVPFLAIFGLNEMAARLPSALFGAGTVVLLYYFLHQLFSKNEKRINSSFPLFASLFLAINPWHIQVSRMALEANVSLFIFLLGLYFLLKSFNKVNFFYIALFLFSLTLYTYNSCRVFVPIFLIAFFSFYQEEFKKKFFGNWKAFLVFTLLLLCPLILSGFRGTGERLFKVGIFTDPGILARINQERADCLKIMPQFFCQAYFNRPVGYTKVFIQNYLSHFSQNFLIWQGGNLAQYSMPNRGMLYLFELPFIILGIFYLLKFKKEFLVLFVWLLVAPVANSFTGAAHPIRAIHLVPLFPIFAAAGIMAVFSYLKKSPLLTILLKIGLILVILVSLVSFLVNYFVAYPQVYTSTWQGGYRELYSKLAKYEKDYQKIIVTKFYGEPHIYYLFYSKYPPALYQEGVEVIRFDREDRWVDVDRVGQYYFSWKIDFAKIETDTLVAVSPDETPADWFELDEVRWQDGKTAFKIIRPYEKR